MHFKVVIAFLYGLTTTTRSTLFHDVKHLFQLKFIFWNTSISLPLRKGRKRKTLQFYNSELYCKPTIL